ncbi:MAG: spore germination protein [Lachnospiraceae bacterium]
MQLIYKDFDATISNINNTLRINESFDLIYRTITIGEKSACLYFIDGFVKDDIMQKLQDYFSGLTKEDMNTDAHSFLKKLPYVEADMTDSLDSFKTNIFSGVTGLIIDGFDNAILIDCRTYPARGVDEPDKDKVLRGSRDGFVETIVMNAALIRRRIRSENLTIKMMNVGSVSKTDVALCYMDNTVDKKKLKYIEDKINSITVSSLTMNQESLAECLHKKKWLNPFPKFKYSERPDTTASAILEGHIVILVDNSPASMIIPTTFFDVIEEADDYYFPPITATYLRLSRFIITIASLLVTPIYLFLMQNEHLIPEWLSFIKITDDINVPIFLQLIILEIAIDGLKLAAVNTPNMLNTPLSVIAGLILGESAVSSGWFNDSTMLYMAFVAFGNFTHGSFELGYAWKLFRIMLLTLIWLFNGWGFIAGIIIIIGCLFTNKTVTGDSYMYPLFPFSAKKMCNILLRPKKGE